MIKRTSNEWAAIAGVEIIDDDGWRAAHVTLDTPIDIVDFGHYLSSSTIRSVKDSVTITVNRARHPDATLTVSKEQVEQADNGSNRNLQNTLTKLFPDWVSWSVGE